MRLSFSIFLISFSVVALEIALSRLLSVLLSYHYVFLVLSLALLGLGLGGILAFLFRPQLPPEEKRLGCLGWHAFFFSLALPVSIWGLIQLERFAGSPLATLLVSPVLCLPFLAAGLFLAEMYRFFPGVSHRLYGMDLLGAGGGAWGAVVMLNSLGGTRVYFLIAAAGALVALILTCRRTTPSKSLPALSLCALVLCLGLASDVSQDWFFKIPVGRNPEKEIHDALTSFQGELADHRWTAFGRTDLVRYRSRPELMDLYVDGTAGSPMYRFSGRLEELTKLVETELADFPGSFPFKFLKPDARNSALIIGPGGGRDILLALWGGLKNIKAVEINGDLVDLVRRHSVFNGGIYDGFPNVGVVVDEGRRFMRGQAEPHDLIFLSLPVTNTSRSLEGYALTENYLFTLESMAEYWEHLTGEGSLVVVGHNDAEILRLLVMALNMMEKRGFSHADAMQHVYVVGSDEYLCFVLRKAAFSPVESMAMHRAMVMQGFQPASSFFPFVQAVNPSLLALSLGRIGLDDLVRQVQAQGWDIRPVNDNRPFFYKLETGIPRPILIACGAVLVLYPMVLFLPWTLDLKQRRRGKNTIPSSPHKMLSVHAIGLFSLLGMGFMVGELSLLARFTLLFGSPSIAMAVFLSALLGWAGLGSWISRRWRPGAPEQRIRAACLAIVPIMAGYAALLPWALFRLAPLDDAWRLLACVCLLMPIGIIAGVPFPSAVQWLKNLGMENHIPWMYGINGVSSVAGSVLSLLVATSFGFQQALLASAACYLLVYFLMRIACEQNSTKLKTKNRAMAVT
jgi:predicted membrane-bound spermidine synthase